MLNDSTLPATFRVADQASLDGQAATTRSIRLSLWFGVLAAACGLLASSQDLHVETPAAGIAGLGFAGSLLLTLRLQRNRSQEQWFAGRAVAESARSLAWRYATGGDPFPVDAGAAADTEFEAQLIEARLRGDGLVPPPKEESEISAEMRTSRASSLPVRREGYLVGRIDDQIGWYTGKSDLNRVQAGVWSRATALANVVGISAAVAQFLGVLSIDVFGFAAAAAGAATAWTQTRQHTVLHAAYSDAAQDLANARQRLGAADDEESWSHLVGQAEEAISREHTMWIARAGG